MLRVGKGGVEVGTCVGAVVTNEEVISVGDPFPEEAQSFTEE